MGEAVGLGGSGAGETTKEKGRRTGGTIKVYIGRGARAQAPAGKNDHGDSERGGSTRLGWAGSASTEARTAEKRRWRAHEPARLHSCSKFTTPGSYYSNISKYSTLYVATFLLRQVRHIYQAATVECGCSQLAFT